MYILSHKKEHIWINSNEVDEPRAYYTKWSKSKREKQVHLDSEEGSFWLY